MSVKKPFKNRIFVAIFGCFFILINLLGNIPSFSTPVYAEPTPQTTTEPTPTTEPTSGESTSDDPDKSTTDSTEPTDNSDTDKMCKNQLGVIGWLVCPTTGKIAEAVDWLYDKIEDILIINPISTEDSSPIYNIWKYFRDITNIIFIIYLLIIIYSQITGRGINNYGIKRALPKLIVAVILVNLSFIVCSLAVEVSNIVGKSLRGVFTSIEEASLAAGTSGVTKISFSSMYGYIAGGTAATIAGGVIAIEAGALWMLIPTVLGAIVAVVSGLITIALRQTVVALLIMIAPLAFVANILPNTEDLFQKWKKLLTRMLVFYPLFSLLFGASSLAGWAIISSAKDGFAVILGMGVQVFPLFFSWSLMKMSGTALGTINEKLRGIAAKPIAATTAWAESRRQLTKQKYLASKNPYTPSLRLAQYLSDRRIAREGELTEYSTIVKNRGLAYGASRHYRKDGTISRDGEEAYEMQARNVKYQSIIMRDSNNFKNGLSDLKDLQGRSSYRNTAQLRRLETLDTDMVNAADSLKYEAARGAKIDFVNARGFQERTSRAVDAHFDTLNKNNPKYQQHNTSAEDLARYNTMLNVMDHEAKDIHFAAAEAAYSFNAQNQIVQGKFQKYFDLSVPTQDVVHRLTELTTSANPNAYIDEIIAGMRTLNMRGDTKLVQKALDETLRDNRIEFGTYASQALSSFFMFDVKDNDPFLRRFGKYINLETARIYNENAPEYRRHNKSISFDEYILGEYDDIDANGQAIKSKAKRDFLTIIKGTSFGRIEREGFDNMQERIRQVFIKEDKDGGQYLDYENYIDYLNKLDDATFANLVGDQFNYLSGSEQIMSLAKYITGKKEKNGQYVDSDDDLEGLKIDNEEEREKVKQALKDFYVDRTKRFFKAQVPNQVARTKTDVLAPAKELLIEQAKKQYGPGHDEQFYKDKAGEILRRSLQGVDENGNGGVYDSLVKMIDKGYQGDTKSGLVEFLHLNDPKEIARVKNKNNKNSKDNFTNGQDEDEDGVPQEMGGNGGQGGNWDLSVLIGKVDRSFMTDQSNTPENIRRFISEMDEMLAEHGLDDVAIAFNEYCRNDSTANILSIRNQLESLLRKYNS